MPFFKRQRLVIIMLLVIFIALLYYLLEGHSSPQTSKVHQSVNIKFKSLSYQALLSHYPYYEPIFDDSETNNGVAIQDVKISSDEIARTLVEKQLDSYSKTNVKNEKIDEYKIHSIKIIKEVEDGAVFSALYSVKVNASDSRWSLGALKQPDMWEVGKRIYASYYKENGQFVLNIIGPNAIAYYEPTQKPNDSKIATNLFVENYLEPNFLPEKSDGSRLLQYKINHVQSPQDNSYMFHFVYSVQGIEGKTNWDAGSGEIGENGWMNQKSISLKIQRYGDFYEGIVRGP